jgi:hypothetical protein
MGREHNKLKLASITGKPNHVEIAALKTIEAYKEAYRDKGVVPTSKNDFARGEVGYRQVQETRANVTIFKFSNS